MELSEAQFHRYARHLILDEVGEEGQERLLAARVLIVGAGGLGSPLLLYLAAAGVGTLGLIDHDTVDLTNLQRQIAHGTERIGMAKVESARLAIASVNPEIRVETHAMALDASNVASLVASYDVIADGSDNFATRYLLTDACFAARKPLVAAALAPFDGQLSTYKPYLGAGHPCYRCLFREAPPPDLVPRCETAGILGAVAGVVGTLQAVEVLKELLGIGESLSGTLLMYDALDTRFQRIKLPKDPDCPTCGTTIRPATLAELEAIERIVAESYEKYIARIGKKPGPMLDDYRRRITEGAISVALADGAVAGLIVLLPESDHLLLDNVAVAGNFQGKGIGRRLIDFAEAEARRRGFGEIRLYTHQTMHENIALYPRLGYEETGRFTQDGYDRVFFRKRLGQGR
jgi:molybdopterin/thiamine biosynthesis adenylyltransferase/ribosomal protein S18 acetylase RimI-like enzyme